MMPVSLLQKLKQTTNTARAYLDPRQVGDLIFYVTNPCNFRWNFCFYSAFRCFMGIEIEVLVVNNCIARNEAQDPAKTIDCKNAFERD